MARYLLMVLSGPTGGPGDEEAYNRWYDEIHLPDLKALDGVVSARRYRTIQGNLPEMARFPYVAAYEIETDDLAAVFAAMEREPRPFDPAYDRSRSANLVAVQISGDP